MNKFLVLSLLFLVFSCATERPGGKTEAEVLFKEAKELADDEHYTQATEKLNTLRSKFPYSFYSAHAELLQAEILYKQESFVEAAAAFTLFRDFHPKHEKRAYVTWMIGQSYFNQLPDTVDPDLTSAQEAIKYFDEIINKYPDPKYLNQAKEQKARCKQMLRDKEKYIADFYYKTEVFDAARYRYLYILRSFSERNLVDHSALRVVEASLQLGDKDGCKKYAKAYMDRVSDEVKDDIKSVASSCQ